MFEAMVSLDGSMAMKVAAALAASFNFPTTQQQQQRFAACSRTDNVVLTFEVSILEKIKM